MSEIAPSPLTHSPRSESHWGLAQRVADSSLFRRGPKLRAFLLYICENAILGRHENLTAQLIGTRVFGRPSEYNLNEDNIVRVEARELRKRLEAYFAGEGRHEPVVIEVPKGSYIPVFRNREQPRAGEAVSPAGNREQPRPGEAVPPARLARRWRLLFASLAAALIVSAGAALWLAVDRSAGRRPAPEYSCYADLLGTLGAIPDRETLLVLSNPPIVTYFGSETDQPTGELERRVRAPRALQESFGFALKEFDRTLPHHFLSQSRADFTGMGEAIAAYHLGRLLQTLGRSGRLTQSRFLNWDKVQKQDLVLLGGPSSNDWSYQDDAKSNFKFVRGGINNEKPFPGELKFYPDEPGATPGTRMEYGVLKMLTSPYGFETLLLAGVTSAGTAGVAEFFTSPVKMSAVRDRIHAAGPRKPFPSDWEVLIRIAVRDSLSVETSAVAVRPSAPKP